MAKAASAKNTDRISDDAVKKATGKTWTQWFAVLDKSGARKLPHPEIARLIYTKHKCPGWWSQMVTVAYERERGMREKYETPSGYQVSRSATIAVPVARLFEAWQDKRTRRRWLKDPAFVLRKAMPNKSMRITWADGKTNLEVNFYAKGAHKSQVTVQHTKLADAKEVERKRAYWTGALEQLKRVAKA